MEAGNKIHIGEGMRLENRKLLAWAKDENGKLTEEFKLWFQDSMLIDEQGIPLIFYHGTLDVKGRESFSKLASGHVRQVGFHFGGSDAARDAIARGQWKGENARILPVISMKRPLRMDDIGNFTVYNLADSFEEVSENDKVVRSLLRAISLDMSNNDPKIAKESEQRIKENMALFSKKVRLRKNESKIGDYSAQSRLLHEFLAQYGYDGIIYRNEVEGNESADSIITFYPSQVRSATTGEYIWEE